MAKTNHTRSIDVGKVCSKCGEFKAPGDYYTVKNRQGKPKLESACKKCSSNRRRKRMRRQKGLDPANEKTWRELFGSEHGVKLCNECGVNIWGKVKAFRKICDTCHQSREQLRIEKSLARQKLQSLPVRTLCCAECGNAVVRATRKQRVFCCKSCLYRHNRRNRRARNRQAFVENVSLSEIAIRDKWICQLCGCKVSKNAEYKRQATIDHVIPISKGGLHEMLNCQLAHLDCNSVKHNKVTTLF